jgi:hypothetical protein
MISIVLSFLVVWMVKFGEEMRRGGRGLVINYNKAVNNQSPPTPRLARIVGLKDQASDSIYYTRF